MFATKIMNAVSRVANTLRLLVYKKSLTVRISTPSLNNFVPSYIYRGSLQHSHPDNYFAFPSDFIAIRGGATTSKLHTQFFNITYTAKTS